MWVLPSRSRPHNVARLLKAWGETGASTELCLMVDHDDPLRDAYTELPIALTIHGPRRPLSGLYNAFFAYFPDLDWYGFIADDVVPETPGWDIALIETAGRDGMAVPSGGETTGGCPHFVLGGDLVRAIGFLSLPGLDRLYIDTVWKDIAQARGIYRGRPDVVLKHRHFSNGLALMDSTYRKHRKAADQAIYNAWKERP